MASYLYHTRTGHRERKSKNVRIIALFPKLDIEYTSTILFCNFMIKIPLKFIENALFLSIGDTFLYEKLSLNGDRVSSKLINTKPYETNFTLRFTVVQEQLTNTINDSLTGKMPLI